MAGGRILIAEDHPLTREGLSLAARAALPGAQTVGVGSIADAVAAMTGHAPFRLVLLDYRLPDSHGFAGLLRIQHVDPDVRIVIVTAYEEDRLIEAARALGAAGFLSKTLPLDTIAADLRTILAGGTHFPAGVVADVGVSAVRERIGTLSRAQYVVLLALADGRSNKQIAYDLAISEATVKAHLTAVFRKLHVVNRAQALIAVGPLLQVGDPARGS